VYWSLGTAATLAGGSLFQGQISAGSAISFGTYAQLKGRAMAQTAISFAGKFILTIVLLILFYCIVFFIFIFFDFFQPLIPS
jgi:hypothetical protein